MAVKKTSDGIEGTVVENLDGHIIENSVVYELCFGGPHRPVGYVKNGVAYERVLGGPDRQLSSFRFG